MFNSAPPLAVSQDDKKCLLRLSYAGKTPQRVVLRARIILAAAEGKPNNAIAKALKITRPTVLLWRGRYQANGVPGLLKDAKRPGRRKEVSGEPTQNAIFALLHSPPSQHNINRTSWRLADIRQCLLKQGISVSRMSISRIVRGAGYTWRKAAEVLTSNDPEYKEKLERIKSVLSMLGENDHFCSIDEYGPFAIKLRGGTKLVGPGEHPHVPRFQKSKGRLIVTAALRIISESGHPLLFKKEKHRRNDPLAGCLAGEV